MRGRGQAEGSRQWWAGENRVFTGLSSETEDPGEPGEGQRLSMEAPHPRSTDRKPPEQDLGSEAWGRRSKGRVGTRHTAGGTGSAASGLGALGSPPHTQACWPLSWSPVNTKDHTSPEDAHHQRCASVGHSCGGHWPGYLGRGQGVCLQPGRESE